MPRQISRLLLLAGALLVTGPPGADAATITSVQTPELVVDQSAEVVVTGVVPPEEKSFSIELSVSLNPPNAGCAGTADLDDAVNRSRKRTRVPEEAGAFRVSLQIVPTVAEAATVCAYLDDVYAPATRAAWSAPAPVRAPVTSLAISAPPQPLPAHATFPLQIVATAEVGRQVAVHATQWDNLCGPTYVSNSGRLIEMVTDTPVLGAPPPFTRLLAAPDEGHWHLCGYVHVMFSDPIPTTAVTGAPFWVGPTPWCRLGRLPRRQAKPLAVRCSSNVEGLVELVVQRAGAQRVVLVPVSDGSGAVPSRRLGLTRGRAALVTVRQGETTLGQRKLRRR